MDTLALGISILSTAIAVLAAGIACIAVSDARRIERRFGISQWPRQPEPPPEPQPKHAEPMQTWQENWKVPK